MLVSDQNYLAWQKRLAEKIFFRRFWIFWGIYCVAFFYAGIVFFFIPGFRLMAILAFAAFLLARFVFCQAVYYFFQTVRPYQRLEFSPYASRLFISWLHKKRDSMPSGHAAALSAISIVCFIFFPLLGILAIVATVLNGAARIVLGYHHVSDILAGWFIGIASALIVVFWLSPLLFTRLWNFVRI